MSSDNPYAAPRSDADIQPGVGAEPASRGKRFANFLIDGIVGRLVVFAIWLAIGVLLGIAGRVDLVEHITPLVDIVLSTAMFLGYYFVQEAAFGRTIGKLVTGTTVVTQQGEPITAGQALARTLLRIVPFEPLSALIGKQCMPWHDQYSQTRVVPLRR